MTKYSLIILLAFMVSCLPQSPNLDVPPVCLAEGADTGAFDAGKITAKFTKLPHPPESILDSNFLVEFTACVQNSLNKQPMRNQAFAVHTFSDQREPEEKVKDTLCENTEWGCLPVKTTNDGCLTWEETYNYALPAEQRWIEFKRVIAHRSGSRVIPMMINPWVQGTRLVDLRPLFSNKDNYLTNNKTAFNLHKTHAGSKEVNKSELQKCKEEGNLDQAFKYLNENEEKAFLWVDQINFSPSRKVHPDDPHYKKTYKICDGIPDEECDQKESLDREGGFLNLKLQIPVHIISDDESGRISPQLAPAGAEFDVIFYLLSEVKGDSSNGGGKKRSYMLHRSIKNSISAVAGSEYIHLDNALLHVPYETTEGTSTILLKVKSRGEEQVEPFYGVYDINDKSIRDLHGISVGLSLRSSESSPSESVDMDRASASNVESQRQRIQEYKEVFEKFNTAKAYAEYKPQAGRDGFDYSTGLALNLSRMRFARIKASGDTCSSPVKRTVVYLGEVCLRDPRINQNLEKRLVTVTSQDMKMSRNSEGRIVVEPVEQDGTQPPIVDQRRADERGCIQFTHELSHKLYDVQKYFMKKLTFKTHDVEESKYIALNPWEYGFLTYQEVTQAYENWYDTHKNYKEKCKNQKCSKGQLNKLKTREFELVYNQCKYENCKELGDISEEYKLRRAESNLAGPLFTENLEPPVLRLNEYRNVIIEPSYKVESSLDVQTMKNLQMFLQPGIVRRDSPGEDIWQIPRVLPIGYYLIRFIIAKGPYETAEGKRQLLDRYLMDPLRGSLNLITNMDLMNHQRRFGKAFEEVTKPTKTPIEELGLDKLDERAGEFEQALKNLQNFYLNKDYDAYGAHLKTANAEKFYTSGCEEGDRIPCFSKEDYITHFDTLAYAENGVLSSFVKLGFSVEHFRHLGSKNSILIEIYPTNPNPEKYYKYKDPSETGGNKCVLDIEKTTFKPFPTCEEGKVHDHCHQMKVPAHWGLFFTTEFGMLNIMWPAERNYTEVFDLDPIEISNKSEFEMKREKNQLRVMENAVQYVHQVHEEDFGVDNRVRVDQAYQSFASLVNSVDRVDGDQFEQYCKNVEEQISKINSKDLKEGENSLSEELSLSWHVCSENMQDAGISLSGTRLRNQIRKYFTYRDFSEAIEQKNINPMEEYRKVQSQEGGFCDKRLHKATAYTDDGSDFSTTALSYHDCVCSSPNEESITKKMARCFAKEQGLVFVENKDFQGKLKNSEDVSLPEVVNSNGEEKSEKFKTFLQSMCRFWFEEYYKNYLNLEDVESIYNKLAENLTVLYDHPNVIIPEEDRFDVNFDDFKNISNSGSSAAQRLQSFYAGKGYEPFIDYTKTSDSKHPYYVCRKDPLKFFHLERKLMVGELDMSSNKTRYKNGRVYSLTTKASQGAQARVELSTRESAALSTRGEVRLGLGDALQRTSHFRGIFRKMINATWGVGPSAEASRTGTTSSSEQNAVDSDKSILLAVNHVEMDLALKKHRSCLLIRPKNNAFEKVSDGHWEHLKLFWGSSNLSEDAVSLMRQPYMSAGLLICNKESSELEVVPENYYYVHQFFGGHAYEFMSRTIYHNRPYTEIIRGKDQMNRFIQLTHALTYNRELKEEDPFQMGNIIRHLELDRNHLDINLIQAFEQYSLNESGFYKGVYTYPDLINYYDFESEKTDEWLDGRFEWIHQLLGVWENVLIDVIPKESIY